MSGIINLVIVYYESILTIFNIVTSFIIIDFILNNHFLTIYNYIWLYLLL